MHNVNSALDTPWKAVNEISRIVSIPLFRLYFSLHGVPWRHNWRVFGLPLIQKHKGSTIDIGDALELRNWFGSNPLGINHRSVFCTWSATASILMGNNVGITGSAIIAKSRIRIGNRVLIGPNCTILDNDFHPLAAEERLNNPKGQDAKEVTIGDYAFIGMNTLVLKGSVIGEKSVIGAGSVVVGEIPAGVVAAGNPARIIRKIEQK